MLPRCSQDVPKSLNPKFPLVTEKLVLVSQLVRSCGSRKAAASQKIPISHQQKISHTREHKHFFKLNTRKLKLHEEYIHGQYRGSNFKIVNNCKLVCI